MTRFHKRPNYPTLSLLRHQHHLCTILTPSSSLCFEFSSNSFLELTPTPKLLSKLSGDNYFLDVRIWTQVMGMKSMTIESRRKTVLISRCSDYNPSIWRIPLVKSQRLH